MAAATTEIFGATKRALIGVVLVYVSVVPTPGRPGDLLCRSWPGRREVLDLGGGLVHVHPARDDYPVAEGGYRRGGPFDFVRGLAGHVQDGLDVDVRRQVQFRAYGVEESLLRFIDGGLLEPR